jgi:phage baseplate assembly protein W
MHIDHPFHVDERRRTAQAGDEDHVHDLIEQILFTSPGERVNRPDFGAGLDQLVFGPSGGEVASTVQVLVQGSLQRWLADLVRVEGVEVRADDSVLRVTVQYTLLRNLERRQAQFVRSAGT